MDHRPVSLAGRLVVLSALLLQILLLAHYTSDLVSTLATKAPSSHLATLYDVYKDPSLTLGFIRNTSISEFLGESSIEFHRELMENNKRRRYETPPATLAEGMNRVLADSSYLFMATETVFLHKYGRDCRLFLLPTSYFPTQVSFLVKKNSPFIPVMNKVLTEIWSSGLFNKWWKQWVPSGMDCDQAARTSSLEVRIFVAPFLVLLSTVLASLLVYVGEVCYIRRKRLQ